MATDFLISSADLVEPMKLSPAAVIARLRDDHNLPEVSIHSRGHQYPFVNIEFHGSAGFSILCFANSSSVGRLATVAPQRLQREPSFPFT
jgi:hypothetical protein